MKQTILSEQTGFQRYSKKTKRAVFLEEMEQVIKEPTAQDRDGRFVSRAD